jgi:hypothetical protein
LGDFVDHRGELLRDLLASKFDQAQRRPLIKNYDKQQPTDDRDVNALALAFV